MWALRRAVTSTRSHSCRILGGHTRLDGSDVFRSNLGSFNGIGTKYENGVYLPMLSYPCHDSFLSVSFGGSRMFSSQARAKSNVREGESGDGNNLVSARDGAGDVEKADAILQKATGQTQICIVIRSFDNPSIVNYNLGTRDTRKVRLPESRVLHTVLRSPHIDKKSREQFEMRIKKQIMVIKTEPHELRKKFFWLKRQRIFGAQYEIRLSCKTRLDMGRLQRLR